MRNDDPLVDCRSHGTQRSSRHHQTNLHAYTVVFEPEEETGGYVVTCPALPGPVRKGDTIEEARRMAKDAIEGYLESLLKDGLELPIGERSTGPTPFARRSPSR
ncbi:MAG: type II toxin-antitoxin system HicB family antitoxin [Pseudomonadota bacterium]